MSERFLVVDWDGTVTEDDMLDDVARTFGDAEVYARVEDALHAGSMPLSEVIAREFEPVTTPLDEVVAWIVERTSVRPGFRECVERARAEGWGVRVLSSGFHELIEPLLEREGVDVELFANRVDPSPEGWRVEWRYPEDCEVCGESCKRAVLPDGGEVVYVGNGISDRCAALASDRVFATRGLARYLDERGVEYTPFEDFRDVAAALF